MAGVRCDVCHKGELLTVQDPVDQKFRCSECARFMERLSSKDRQFLRSIPVSF